MDACFRSGCLAQEAKNIPNPLVCNQQVVEVAIRKCVARYPRPQVILERERIGIISRKLEVTQIPNQRCALPQDGLHQESRVRQRLVPAFPSLDLIRATRLGSEPHALWQSPTHRFSCVGMGVWGATLTHFRLDIDRPPLLRARRRLRLCMLNTKGELGSEHA